MLFIRLFIHIWPLHKLKGFPYRKLLNLRSLGTVSPLSVLFISLCFSVYFHPPLLLWVGVKRNCGCSSLSDVIVQKCVQALLGNADCKCSPEELFCLLISLSPTNISVLHMHTDCSEASDWRCKCQLSSTSQLCIPLLFVLWGNELPKWAQYQLACVIHPNRHYPSLFLQN